MLELLSDGNRLTLEPPHRLAFNREKSPYCLSIHPSLINEVNQSLVNESINNLHSYRRVLNWLLFHNMYERCDIMISAIVYILVLAIQGCLSTRKYEASLPAMSPNRSDWRYRIFRIQCSNR